MGGVNLKQFAEKTTEELEEIWRNQDDYVPEVAPMVKAELSRRGISMADAPPIIRVEREVEKRDKERRTGKRLLRVLSVVQVVFGSLGAIYSFMLMLYLWEELSRPESGVTMAGVVIQGFMFLLIVLFTISSVFLWFAKRWAWLGMMVWYMLAIFGIAMTRIMMVVRGEPFALTRPILEILVSLAVIAMLYTARDAVAARR